ncbi:MAG: hypothetical protein V4543_13975 [Bacteroidota bacterium]
MPAKYLLMLLFCLGCFAASAQIQDTTFLDADGWVSNLATDDSTLYIGGSFTHLGPHTGCGLAIDANTLVAQPLGFPKLIGTVTIVISDNSGGWYIFGDLIRIGNTPLTTNLIHLKPNLTLDILFNAEITVGVSKLLLKNNLLYVGGSFMEIGGREQPFLAALNPLTGRATSWSPKLAGEVTAMDLDGNLMYVATYNFYSTGNKSNLDAVDINTGQFTGWNVFTKSYELNYNRIEHVIVKDKTVLVAGYFDSLNNVPVNRIAFLDAVTAQITNRNLEDNYYEIQDLLLRNNTLYVVGNCVWCSKITSLVAYDFETGKQLSPGLFDSFLSSYTNQRISSVTADNGKIVLAGRFTMPGSAGIVNMAVIDSATGKTKVYPYKLGEDFSTAAVFGNKIYIGGYFNCIGSIERNNLASIDLKTKSLKEWNPDISIDSYYGGVTSLALCKNDLYVSVLYQEKYSRFRSSVLKFDKKTGSRNPIPLAEVSGEITELKIRNNRIYIAGRFDSINGQLRRNLAAIDLTNSELLPWSPNITYGSRFTGISGIETDKYGTVYVAGDFVNISGSLNTHLAAFDSITGNLKNWAISDSIQINIINSVLAVNDVIYIGGTFQTITGENRSGIAGISAQSGRLTEFGVPNLSLCNTISAAPGGGLYAYGKFEPEFQGQEYSVGAVNVKKNCLVNNWQAVVGFNDYFENINTAEVGGNLFFGRKYSESYSGNLYSSRNLGLFTPANFNQSCREYLEPIGLPWPNPAENVLYFFKENTDAEPEFYSMPGVRVPVSIQNNTDNLTDKYVANLSLLPMGMYLLRYNGRTYKVVKN